MDHSLRAVGATNAVVATPSAHSPEAKVIAPTVLGVALVMSWKIEDDADAVPLRITSEYNAEYEESGIVEDVPGMSPFHKATTFGSAWTG
jgi:hypothetical protein